MTHAPNHSTGTMVSLAAGETLCGRYRLEKEIGRGGMGVVWKATDTITGATVAIKTLPTALARDERSSARLMAEALRARDLTHPHIVPVYDYAVDPSRAGLGFLVMKFIAGRTLDQLLARAPGGLPPEDVARWGVQIATAIDHAHGRTPKVLHRDIKPANIMIDESGNALLMDFGIACKARQSMTRLTGQDSSSGTLLYMSPQHVQGEPPSKTDDLYSLAAALYEALSGNPPFTHGDISQQIRFKAPPPLTKGPAWLRDQILRGLAKEPAGRPPSAASLAAPSAPAGPPPTPSVVSTPPRTPPVPALLSAGQQEGPTTWCETLILLCLAAIAVSIVAGLVMLAATM